MAKLESPSAQRNKEPIWNFLSSRVLPQLPQDDPLSVLEVAAGCGVHTHHFSRKLVDSKRAFTWYPSDPEESSRMSIQAYVDEEADLQVSVEKPLQLTLNNGGIMEPSTFESLKEKRLDLMICINMIHISPWSATLGLMKTAGMLLQGGGMLYVYGPYKVDGTAVQSNLSFDRSLRMRDPQWGVRDLEDVLEAAKENGLLHVKTELMPANNLSVLFQKEG